MWGRRGGGGGRGEFGGSEGGVESGRVWCWSLVWRCGMIVAFLGKYEGLKGLMRLSLRAMSILIGDV